MKALILLAGPLLLGSELLRAASQARLVIAADRGILHAEALGVRPHLWVGDFDSTDADLLVRWRDVPREWHPRDKDATDAELAVRAALRLGARKLLIVGALGGEPDHELAHHALAITLAEAGHDPVLTDGRCAALPVVPPGRSVALQRGTRFSLIPLDHLTRVDLEGARWTLAGEAIPLGSTRATRNLATGRVRIRLASGRAILVACPPGGALA